MSKMGVKGLSSQWKHVQLVTDVNKTTDQ